MLSNISQSAIKLNDIMLGVFMQSVNALSVVILNNV